MAYQVKAITGKNHTMKEYEKFLSQPFNNNFGVSKEKIADLVLTTWAKSDYYGLTKNLIINDLIPILEDELGGYTVFFVITVVEGGGQANYLNHYVVGAPEGSDDPIQALKNDIAYVKSVWNKDIPRNQQVAMGAPETSDGYNEQLEDNPGASYKMYDKLPKKSIGAYYLPSTLAGNAWIFASEYLQSTNAYYGNAYDQSIDLLEQLGVKDPINDKGGSSNSDDSSSDNDDGNIWNNIDWGKLFPDDPVGAVKKAIEGVFDKIEEMTQWDMHSIGTDEHFSNSYFYIIKTYNNTYKLRMNLDFFKGIEDMIGNLGSDDADASEKDDDDKDDNKNDSGNKGVDGINTCYLHPDRKLQQPYDPDGTNPNYAFGSHRGVDLRMDYETLKSPVDAKVRYTMIDPLPRQQGGQTGWGNHILLDMDDGQSILLAHLESIDVKNGDNVKVGDKLGVTGATGDVFDSSGVTHGQHLHLELWNKNDVAIDPTRWVLDHCQKTKGQDPQYNHTTFQKDK